MTRCGLGLLHIIFHTFVPELWPLIYTKISFPLNVSRTNGQNFTKFYIETEGPRVRASPASLRCGPWARHIYPSLVLVQPRKTRSRITERLLSGRKESNQTKKKKIIYAFILTRSTLGLLHILFAYYYQSNGPWFKSKFCFRSSSWEQIDRISPNFINAFIFNLTRSTVGLLYIIFRTFVPELLPLIYTKFRFYSIFWEQMDRFYICIRINKIYVLIVTHHFCTVVLELWPLVYAKISFPFNILRTIG